MVVSMVVSKRATPLFLCILLCICASRPVSSQNDTRRRCPADPLLVQDFDASNEDDRMLDVRNKESVLLRAPVIIRDSQSNCSIVSAHLYKGVDVVLGDSECSFDVTGTTMNECTISVSCHVGVAHVQNGMRLHIGVLGSVKGTETGSFTVSCDTLDDGKTCSGCEPDSRKDWKIAVGVIVALVAVVFFCVFYYKYRHARLRNDLQQA